MKSRYLYDPWQHRLTYHQYLGIHSFCHISCKWTTWPS